jgi:hypothetical protein
MSDFHYFVSHGLGWKTGATLEEAIEGAFCTSYYGNMRSWLNNTQKEGHPGIPFYCCRVPLAADEKYDIEWFQPKVKGLTECQNRIVTYVTQKKVAHMRDPHDEIRQLKAELENTKQEQA